MEKEDIPFLSQLTQSLEKELGNLERAYKKKDSKSFVESKKNIAELQKSISEILK